MVSIGSISAVAMTVLSAVNDAPQTVSEDPWVFARKLAGELASEPAAVFEPTAHPDAQWFPKAGLGLFMHWGIHSVKGVQPSWAMIKDYPYGGELHPPERYYALAKEFNPGQYDPGLWMAAAARAGFTYAVLTAKHHDGYALWPTAYGDMSTRQYMDGRDLLRPYVEACRKHGLKVGFYFSPGDWHHPAYAATNAAFDYNKRGEPRPILDAEENQRAFEEFYAYTIGQLYELLTRYGKIDVLWFDGMGWNGVSDLHTEQTLAWIRRLQPGIVINDRWGPGDFATPEWDLPDGPPRGWWENCISWNGHWGYNPAGAFQPASWALERLVRARAWGGNFLLNVGPAPDGTMPEGFYARCEELAAWMAHSRDSLIGASPSPGDARASVPITTKGHTWYLHVLPAHRGPVELCWGPEPEAVTLLRTGRPLSCTREADTLKVAVPDAERTALDDVIAVRWKQSQWESAIAEFEEQDRREPPPKGAILFAGSSSIRMWDLKRWFPGLPALNHGFGGSFYWDLVLYADRIIVPYHPKTVVLYAGSNELVQNASPEAVFANLQAVVESIRHGSRDTRIIVLPIRPSVSRWNSWGVSQQVNASIAAFAKDAPDVTCLDVTASFLDAGGKPRAELLQEDGLHLNDTGYEVWSNALRPLLKQ